MIHRSLKQQQWMRRKKKQIVKHIALLGYLCSHRSEDKQGSRVVCIVLLSTDISPEK